MPANPEKTLDELAAIFAELRSIQCQSYPEEVWKRAISLTNQFSIEKICRAISVQSAYFRKKMNDLGNISEKASNFVEIKTKQAIPQDLITIELETPTGFKAKIQGSSFCLCQVLNSLFGEVL